MLTLLCLGMLCLNAQPFMGPERENPGHNVVQLALLLDVSNSMDGLIDQAKSELWSIVNEVSKASKNGHSARLEIALYEYGRETLTFQSGYVRKLLDYTSDLDTISEVLFSLKTHGGEEFCGAVITKSLEELKWLSNDSIYRVIFIAGNEPFNQGTINYSSSCANAAEKHIILNTIHCGDSMVGVKEFWKEGASIGKGEYFFINQNSNNYVEIETPYDSLIDAFNDSMNGTYMGYGTAGATYKMNQITQDMNAKKMGKSVAIKRASSKSNKFAYSNAKWDVVDASAADTTWVKKAKDEELPAEMKGKSISEKKAIILKKEKDRGTFSKNIATLNRQREAYINSRRQTVKAERTLGTALISAIRRQAMVKGFVFVQ